MNDYYRNTIRFVAKPRIKGKPFADACLKLSGTIARNSNIIQIKKGPMHVDLIYRLFDKPKDMTTSPLGQTPRKFIVAFGQCSWWSVRHAEPASQSALIGLWSMPEETHGHGTEALSSFKKQLRCSACKQGGPLDAGIRPHTTRQRASSASLVVVQLASRGSPGESPTTTCKIVCTRCYDDGAEP